jgi:hypothetical protein
MNTEVILTNHAMQKAQARGVTQGAVYWTSLYGEPRRAVGGVFRRTMTKKSAERLLKQGLSPAETSRYLGTVVITKDLDLEERLVITVRPTEKSGRRLGGKHKPKYGHLKLLPLLSEGQVSKN